MSLENAFQFSNNQISHITGINKKIKQTPLNIPGLLKNIQNEKMKAITEKLKKQYNLLRKEKKLLEKNGNSTLSDPTLKELNDYIRVIRHYRDHYFDIKERKKQKNFMSILPLISTIHKNIQQNILSSNGVVNSNGQATGSGSKPTPQPTGPQPSGPQPSGPQPNGSNPKPTPQASMRPENINNNIFNTYVNQNTEANYDPNIDQLMEEILKYTYENGLNITNQNLMNQINFKEPGFDNDSNKCYRNVALHLLLTILKSAYYQFTKNGQKNNSSITNYLFKDTIVNNNQLRQTLLNILKKNITTNPIPQAGTFVYTNGNRKNQYNTTEYQDTNEYIKDLFTHFFSEHISKKCNINIIKLEDLKKVHSENIIAIGPQYISNNKLDFEDIIKKYLKYNILHIPKENEFIILQINPKNLNQQLINYSIHSPLKINIYGFTYIINDISYYCGDTHYVNHSYRENKWFFYDDIGNTDDKKGTEVNPIVNENFEYQNSSHIPTTILLRRIREKITYDIDKNIRRILGFQMTVYFTGLLSLNNDIISIGKNPDIICENIAFVDCIKEKNSNNILFIKILHKDLVIFLKFIKKYFNSLYQNTIKNPVIQKILTLHNPPKITNNKSLRTIINDVKSYNMYLINMMINKGIIKEDDMTYIDHLAKTTGTGSSKKVEKDKNNNILWNETIENSILIFPNIQPQNNSSRNNFNSVKTECYKTLGLEPGATERDIKEAYRKLALKYHPNKTLKLSKNDRNKYTEEFKQISKCYKLLTGKNT